MRTQKTYAELTQGPDKKESKPVQEHGSSLVSKNVTVAGRRTSVRRQPEMWGLYETLVGGKEVPCMIFVLLFTCGNWKGHLLRQLSVSSYYSIIGRRLPKMVMGICAAALS